MTFPLPYPRILVGMLPIKQPKQFHLIGMSKIKQPRQFHIGLGARTLLITSKTPRLVADTASPPVVLVGGLGSATQIPNALIHN